ncbi:MAG: hypothetical protein JXA28_07010 [Bacteroidetes bacterium]|nr:hypothetical protein [Bacteroidota bacterium]
MLFRILLFALIGWFIYRIYRRLTGSSSPGGASRNPFQRSRRHFDGKAVDADFEELDDDRSSK